MKKILPDRIILISFLSGAAALIYELVSQRYLSLIMGGEAYTIAVVVGCYMIGLSAGSLIFGAFADKNQKLALRLSILGFAALCGLSPLLYQLINLLAGGGSMPARVAICFIFVLPATICAGGVIPCLVKNSRKVKSPAYIYAANTLGSVTGALFCGYLLIRTLGISASALLGSGIALFCGLLAFLPEPKSLSAPKRKTEPKSLSAPKRKAEPKSLSAPKRKKEKDIITESEPREYSRIIVVGVIAAYCVSGFASMTFQVFQTKILTLFFRDSVYDFAVILTVYLIGLFAGNMFGGRVAAKRHKLLFGFALTQILAGAAVIIGLYIVNFMPAVTSDLASQTIMFERYGENAFLMSNIIKAGYSAMVVLLPAFLWGMGFPLVSRIALAGEKNIGRTTGFIIGINTLFCSAGALLSAFWLVNILGIRGLIAFSAIICALSGTVLAGSMFVKYLKSIGNLRFILPGAVVLTACLWMFLPGWDRFEMSTSFLEPGQNVKGAYDMLFYREDAYGITSVVDFFPTEQKFLTTNRRFCQNSSDLYGPEDHQRLGILPLLIHQRPKDVLMVGLGAGITLRGANLFPGVNIDCVEISKAVADAAKNFGEENNYTLDADNVNIIINDGRNYIKSTEKSYDVIIADIFFPMSSGSSSLFSLEYYEMCKDRLNQNGLMVQWIPVHQFSNRELGIVIKTFSAVFENCQLWYGLIGTSVPVIGIVGSEKAVVIDGARISELYDDQTLHEALSMIALDDGYMLLSHFINDVKNTAINYEDIPVNTDDKPILEYLNPENNDPFYWRLDENMRYVSQYKSVMAQSGYCINIDQATLEEYNREILEYLFSILDDEDNDQLTD